MTKVLKCKDIAGLNPRCPFEWCGHSEDEILSNAAEHIVLWHKPQNIPDVLWAARNAIRDEDEVRGRSAGANKFTLRMLSVTPVEKTRSLGVLGMEPLQFERHGERLEEP